MLCLIDALHQAWPMQAVINRLLAVAPRDPPLWNPQIFCGSPLLADPQSGLLYPPYLVFRFFPFGLAQWAFILVHLSLAAAGMFAWLREEGIGRGPSLLGSLALGMGTH